jgi:hypothetical protein
MILNTKYDILKDINPLKITVGSVTLKKEKFSHYALYEKNECWFGFNYKDQHSIKEFYYPAEIAYGHCILSGLGMGILASLLLKNNKVKSITIYEKYANVIDLNKIISFIDLNQINIINKPIEEIKSIQCDCLFLDHYENEPDQYLIDNSKKIAENIKHDKLWVWRLDS